MTKVFSIRYKLGIVFFGGVFLLVLALIGLQQYHSYVQFKRYIEDNAVTAVRAAIYLGDTWFNSKTQSVQILANAVERSVTSGTDLEGDFLYATRETGLKNAYAGLEDGRFVPRAQGRARNHAGEEWYRKAKSERAPSFFGPYPDPDSGKYKMTFSVPITDPNAWFFKGAVGLDVFLEELAEVMGSVFVSEVERVDYFELGKKPALFVKTKSMSESETATLLKKIQEQGEEGDAHLSLGIARYLIVKEPFSQAKLWVVYPVPLTQLVKPLLVQTVVLFVITGIGLWIIVKVTWAIIRAFIARIEDLNATSKKIAEGNFSTYAKKTSRDEIGELAESFNRMVDSLKEYMKRLEVSVREKEQIAKELEIASELQQNALPREMPLLNGLEISAASFPAKHVGGDYYDFMYPASDKIGFIIADAAGKGFPGSLYMSNSRTIFRVVAKDAASPSQLFNNMNEYMSQETSLPSGMFITYVYGVYDGAARTMTYCNAGHFPPLLYKGASGAFHSMGASGLPIGIAPGETYTEESVPFAKGDIMVMYTDGIIESMNLKGEMFGVERLQEIIKDAAALHAQEILTRISDAIRKFSGDTPQHDDITLVVVRASR